MRFCTAEESRLKKLLELQTTKICAERMRKRDDAWAHEGGRVERGQSTDNKESGLQQESAPINGISY